MDKVLVQFDKTNGLSVIGENLLMKFSSLKEAFAFMSDCHKNPYIKNIQIKRIDNQN